MTPDDLALMPAHVALTEFRARRLSPVELTTALIDRAEADQGRINPFTFTYFDAALDAAKRAEASYMGKGSPPRALEGLCVAIKDAGHIAGLPTSAGSLTMPDIPQPVTSPINERVLEAGGIAHARSATPEFSCATFTHSRRWGVTRNPWNPEFTPGGSSGGAAAALAAGMTSLATGSDIGGSIRIPASCCHVVGYKPPRGRTPVDVPFNLEFYCHTGPLARTVTDTIILQNVMCGPHPRDVTTLRPKKVIPLTHSPIAGLKIAVSMDLGFYDVDSEVVRNTNAMLDRLRDMGAEVEHITLPWDRSIETATEAHLTHVFGTSIAPALAQADLMTGYARRFAEEGLASDPQTYLDALYVAGRAGEAFSQAMAGFDAFICPTTATASIAADFDPLTDSITINGQRQSSFLGWVMTAPFNMLSSHPVLAVPSGWAASNLPTGMQIVGRPYDDDMVFRIGLALEHATGGFVKRL